MLGNLDKYINSEYLENEIKKKKVKGDKTLHEAATQNMSDIPMKPFNETALGRTIAGENKTGRLIHSTLDVLPLPNVHEVIKAVIKDEKTEGKVLGTTDIIIETFKRLDWLRTVVGLLLAAGYIFGYVNLEKVIELINAISGLL